MNIKKFLSRHITIDIIILGFVGILCLLILYLTLPKGTPMIIEIKLINTTPGAENSIMDNQYAVDKWLIDKIKQSKSATNIFGNPTAEVQKILSWGEYSKQAFVTVKVLAKNDRNRNIYKYNYQNLQTGEKIEIILPSVKIYGIITNVYDPFHIPVEKNKFIKVKAKLVDMNTVFPETRGIENYISPAFKVGDTMQNEEGLLAEIIEKTTTLSEKIITTSDGRIVTGYDPIKQDVNLTIKLLITEKDTQLLYLKEKPIRIGSWIPIVLSNITIFPVITEIVHEQ
jgi:hypothetical protein